MMKTPVKIKQRKFMDPKLGIKSSLSDIRVAIATLYVLYVANERKSTCYYCEQRDDKIFLSKDINVKKVFDDENIESLIENSPLFKSQFESLFVFISLIYSLGIIKFDDDISDSSERTGNKRYAKHIIFSANIMILDAILSSYSEGDIKDFVSKWLVNRECSNKELDDKIKQTLQIFSEQTIYKLRMDGGEDLILQTEGIYDAIENDSDEISIDSSEPVGPFRIIKSAMEQGLNPYLQCKNKSVSLNPKINYTAFLNYRDMVSTLLDISKRDTFNVPSNETQKRPSSAKISTQYRPFLTAIKSKPFVLLAGLSGTGKSRIVRELARACWDKDSEEYNAQKPRNFEMIQVKPNWHDSSELLGYVSRVSGKPMFVAGDFLRFIIRAWSEPDIPYFLCLDEMNLAPVEQYFAEYLSVIESRKVQEDDTILTDSILKDTDEEWYKPLIADLTKGQKTVSRDFLIDGISLPQNLIVIGTVNMDETTYSFSRKVLDRAMTIEMNEFNLYGGLDRRYEEIDKLSSKELIGTTVEGVDVYAEYKEVCDIALDYLSKVNETLAGTPFSVAYRTRNELLLYVVNNLPYNKDEEGNELSEGYVIARALDEITSMKILSRIEGDDTKVSDKLLSDLSKAIEDGLNAISGEEKKVESVSIAKIEEMKNRLSSGYTSYWS